MILGRLRNLYIYPAQEKFDSVPLPTGKLFFLDYEYNFTLHNNDSTEYYINVNVAYSGGSFGFFLHIADFTPNNVLNIVPDNISSYESNTVVFNIKNDSVLEYFHLICNRSNQLARDGVTDDDIFFDVQLCFSDKRYRLHKCVIVSISQGHDGSRVRFIPQYVDHIYDNRIR